MTEHGRQPQSRTNFVPYDAVSFWIASLLQWLSKADWRSLSLNFAGRSSPSIYDALIIYEAPSDDYWLAWTRYQQSRPYQRPERDFHSIDTEVLLQRAGCWAQLSILECPGLECADNRPNETTLASQSCQSTCVCTASKRIGVSIATHWFALSLAIEPIAGERSTCRNESYDRCAWDFSNHATIRSSDPIYN